jgi:thiaminase/transcriptional activator TenA
MFSEEAFERSREYVERFLEHRFLRELSEGKLPLKKFIFYIQQDNIFLKDMDQARKVLAAREKSERSKNLSSLLNSVYRHELRARRDLVSKELKIREYAQSAPTTLAYTSYLIRLAYTGSFEEAFTSLIPCPRLYTMIGDRYSKCPASEHRVYGKWLSIYTSSEMKNWSRKLLKMLDGLASKNPSKKEEVMESYLTSCRYEIRFFDMAYNMESWD